MNPEQIQRLLDRRPFVPMRVLTSGGETYEIYHPETAFATQNFVYLALYGRVRRRIARDAVILSVLHVTGIEDLTPVRERNGGSARARKR
jgi:hypothetical protein